MMPCRAHSLVVFSCCVLLVIANTGSTIRGQAGQIQRIAPSTGRVGDAITIEGVGFGALNVTVTVGGIPAAVTAASGVRVTFIVPAGAGPGPVTVSARNPGGASSTIAFTVVAGTVLTGPADRPALQALVDLPPVPVAGSDVEDGVILTRLAVRLRPDATVGQVNAALSVVAGSIVAMHPATLSMTIEVPRQASRTAVEELARLLSAQPGIRAAWPGQLTVPLYAPFQVTPGALASQRFLLPSRFPAAWNAAGLAYETRPDGSLACRRTPVPLLIPDYFGAMPQGFAANFPLLQPPAAAPTGLSATEGGHGYSVARAAAGLTGANPFVECLDVRLLQTAGQSVADDLLLIARSMPTGKFIVNYSIGYQDRCLSEPCAKPADSIMPPEFRAWDALAWKELTHARWSDFLVTAAAGNDRQISAASLWPGVEQATLTHPMGIAGRPDPTFTFAGDDLLWSPQPTDIANGYTPLTAPPSELAALASDAQARNLDGPDKVARNVVVVGSSTNVPRTTVTTTYTPPEGLAESDFSDRGSEVRAIGESLFDQQAILGTSFAAPQVAGLASYLWLLSPELRSQTADVTKHAIVSNARNGTIDAYATVLSLDNDDGLTVAGAPMRMAILDVDRNGLFTESDVESYLRAFYFVDVATDTITFAPPADDTVKLDIYDLNGDGFSTSISRRERFDLDRVGSTLFGPTLYSTVTQQIEGQEVDFDERELTDVEILCYYAYSPLYQGDVQARRDLLAGRCGSVVVDVTPGTVSLPAGGAQQFAATVSGTTNGQVTWSATGGTISATGLYTAGNTPGTFSVTARSMADPSASDTATVTVGATTGVRRRGNFATLAVQALTGLESGDCGDVFRQAPEDAESWMESSSCGASSVLPGSDPAIIATAAGSGNASFQETYAANGDLLSVSATFSGNASATSTDAAALGSHASAAASYALQFAITVATQLTVQVQGSSSGLITGRTDLQCALGTGGTGVFIGNTGAAVSDTFTIPASSQCYVSVSAGSAGDGGGQAGGGANFNLSMSFAAAP